MNEPVRPTPLQTEIIQQPDTARLLVTAGAGTGKTFALIHRLAVLVEELELGADEIVVLSFSRAAVREITDRLAAYGEGARHVEVRTFDSFASRLLAEFAPEGHWTHSGYEERIRAATLLLRTDVDAIRHAAEIRHLVVDEVQDLVGARAELVKALLDKTEGGFTLLGDPAQGIYGFQLEEPQERLRGAAALCSWIRNRFEGSLVEKELTENFRARRPEARVALELGRALRETDADFASIQHRLRTELLASMPLGTLTDAAPLLGSSTVPTALLCRTNGQALLVSRELNRCGVAHRLQRSAQDRVIPAWMADLFLQSDGRLSFDEVGTLLARHDVVTADAWSLLKRMDRNRQSKILNLNDVRDRLASGTVPDELTRQQSANLVVSTIHRVKGLEFDNVIVVDPGEAGDDAIEQAEYARILFVAMTRPRDLLLHLKPVDNLANQRLKRIQSERWAELGFGKYNNSYFGIEVRADDIHTEDPAGTVACEDTPLDIQRYLADKVSPGDSVALVQASDPTTGQTPRYLVEHEGTRIGVTTEQFSQTIRHISGRNTRTWPESIDNLRVDCVETVVGSEAAARNHGLGWSGVWLRPRLTGLGKVTWRSKERT